MPDAAGDAAALDPVGPSGLRRQPHRASSDSRGRPDHRRRNAAFDHEYWQVQRRAHEFPGGQPLYTYTIDWGDGTPFDSGTATIDSFGQSGSPILESWSDGAHTSCRQWRLHGNAHDRRLAPRIQRCAHGDRRQRRAHALHGRARSDHRRRERVGDYRHRHLHRSGLRQSAQRRRRDLRAVHVRRRLGRRDRGRLGLATIDVHGCAGVCPTRDRSTARTPTPTMAFIP